MAHQEGYIYKENGFWRGRWRENVQQPDGSVKRVQRSKQLAAIDDRHRNKRDVTPFLAEILAAVNDRAPGTSAPSTMAIIDFVERVYLPGVKDGEKKKRRSTAKAYRAIWYCHVKQHIGPGAHLRDFDTTDACRLLDEVSKHCVRRHKRPKDAPKDGVVKCDCDERKLDKLPMSITTLKHVKAMMSGVFKAAKNKGYMRNRVNPMFEAELPNGAPEGETYAYSLAEVFAMLKVLPEPARTVVATAAYTGLREGELRGLNIEDYNGDSIHVSRSIWRSVENAPKSRKSAGDVPVIPDLAALLDEHVLRMGSPTSGPLFRSPRGKRVRTDMLRNRVIVPMLEFAVNPKVDWYGWHGFRRGLATNLHDLGVPDITIQQILRHSDVSVTQKCYIKRLPQQAIDAMAKLPPIPARCAVVVQEPTQDSAPN